MTLTLLRVVRGPHIRLLNRLKIAFTVSFVYDLQDAVYTAPE